MLIFYILAKNCSIKKHFHILFFTLFCWNFSTGQDVFNTYSTSKLTPDNGLSQGSNYFRFEDSQGFMWLTGNDALNRYDGKTVKVYNLDKYFDHCPKLQQGYGFAEDDQSNIYIGSVRGLYIYHRSQDRFSLQKIFKNNQDDIAMPFAFKEGKIWCFNKEYRLATYDIKTHKTEIITQLKISHLLSVHIYELEGNVFYYHYPFMDKFGNFWFIENKEVLKYNPKTNTSSNPFKDFIRKKDIEFFSSYYDRDTETLYFGTDKGVLLYNLITNRVALIEKIEDKIVKNVFSIAANKDRMILKSNKDIYFINNNKRTICKANLSEKYNLFKSNSFGFDKSNRLWICDDGKGQVIFDFHQKTINKVPNESLDIDYFSNSGVGRFAEFSNNKTVIPINSPNQNNLIVDDRSKNEIRPIYFPIHKELKNFGMLTDFYRKGIWFYEDYLENKKHQKRLFLYHENGKIDNEIIQHNIEDFGFQQDMVFFDNQRLLCAFTKGLYWLFPESKKFVRINVKYNINLFKINQVDKNHLAISYINNDMLLFEVTPDYQLRLIKKILPKIQSFYIQKDLSRNVYWVGSNQGIYLLDKNFNILKVFNANNDLAGTYIYGLLLDNDGNVYCSHQHGLSSIDAKTFQVINFDKNDGIQDWDFNNRAFYKATDGTLFFGGVSGYNSFKPPLRPYSYYKPEVYIDEILVNNSFFNSKRNSNSISQLNLNYDQNNLSIKALVKDLANANSRELIYKLKGIDGQWKHLDNGRSINFNNLAPNKYTLQLGVYDKFTNKEMYQKMILITIFAPFYKTLWFWVLMAFGIIGCFFWAFNIRKFKNQKRKFEQQLALEQQRNRITADLHDDIGATLSSLQINSAVANQLMEKNPLEAHRVLTKIEYQAQNLADKIGDIIWSMKPSKDEFMTMSARIKTFANDILGSTDVNYEIYIDPKIDKKITDITARKNIVLILKEAINNVAKYSKAKILKINLELVENTIHIRIADNGIGFINDETKGNGIGNMQKRVVEIKGEFTITSTINCGTSISITIPCP
ncbi:sensor histidine kinase [Flavobacterium muglaense]|uniref:histidine kinase n=1 Tax=Flavobacterium muglaense TaxID=2764716 RepID=A0A923SEY2_9FLAO|nr:histidine kinase [Flavobacterium muglaense]MBC5837536.1 hypothetical protein [Flavobacterium muglaense]MBC5844047.1 hypothetical protein [Flavobacterium muglaense]